MREQLAQLLFALTVLSIPLSAEPTEPSKGAQHVTATPAEEGAQVPSGDALEGSPPASAPQATMKAVVPAADEDLTQSTSDSKPIEEPNCEDVLDSLLGATVKQYGSLVIPEYFGKIGIQAHGDNWNFDAQLGGQCFPGDVRKSVREVRPEEPPGDLDSGTAEPQFVNSETKEPPP